MAVMSKRVISSLLVGVKRQNYKNCDTVQMLMYISLPFFSPQEAVRVLIRHSADVNARDKNWQTPLHVAAANNALRCAEVIIPLLSSVNVSDRGGRTALHHAALNGHTEVLQR